ncbi:MAG: tetratricopeptide repeat protein [Gemmatimonadetes bacterium]|nr:tetratricopeptide repeat protein [Gemmatimonadota bacterium]
MAEPFLSSEEYDERAHQLYNNGDYEGALAVLKEGLGLYPNAVDLYVGLGYARLAREEYVWARHSFERALVLDPTHEDALVGLGEVLLKFGEGEAAKRTFKRVESMGFGDDLDIMLSVGRALYREGLYAEARDAFGRAVASHPDSAEALASLAYALHRLGDEVAARRQLRRALKQDPELHEARIYLGHLLYDRGDWDGALREFEAVPPQEHWDPLALWRVIELSRAFRQWQPGDPRLQPWEARISELDDDHDDPVDRLLAEFEAEAEVEGESGRGQLELFESGRRGEDGRDRGEHEVRTRDGVVFRGTWYEIVRQMRDDAGFSHETVAQYMRRLSERWREQSGLEIPFTGPETFLRAAAGAGLLHIDVLSGS